MVIAARDPKLSEYAALLCDRSRPASELELRRILRELEEMVTRTSELELTADLYNLQGICHRRLGQPSKAIDDFRRALQRLREPTSSRAATLSNQASVFLDVGRYREAALSSLEASRIPEGYNHVTLGNLAEALYRLGETDAASRTFQEALRVADLTSPSHCFNMADQAAVLGLDQDAIELFARFVVRRNGGEGKERPAIEVARTASEEDKSGLKNVPVLDATIRRMSAMATELARLSSQQNAGRDDASAEDAQDVYDATRRLREEALAHVLLG
jgi:tetratricopeptide (TPR) repeat protein